MAKTKTVTRYRNRPQKKRRKKNGFTIPLTVAVPVAYLAADGVSAFQKSGLKGAASLLTSRLTGYSPDQGNFDARRFKYNLFPLLVGAGMHKLANKIGINRALANAGIPWIRI